MKSCLDWLLLEILGGCGAVAGNPTELVPHITSATIWAPCIGELADLIKTSSFESHFHSWYGLPENSQVESSSYRDKRQRTARLLEKELRHLQFETACMAHIQPGSEERSDQNGGSQTWFAGQQLRWCRDLEARGCLWRRWCELQKRMWSYRGNHILERRRERWAGLGTGVWREYCTAWKGSQKSEIGFKPRRTQDEATYMMPSRTREQRFGTKR